MIEEIKSEAVILCEGYYDRAFWGGLLLELHCKSLKPPPDKLLVDPFEIEVRGDYAYSSNIGHFIRVRPCGTKDDVPKAADVRLKRRNTKPLKRLILNVDADLNADGTESSSKTINRQSVVDLVRRHDANMREAEGRLIIVDALVVNVEKAEVTLDKRDVKRDSENKNAAAGVAAVLVGLGYGAISGGPKTPPQTKAGVNALYVALEEFVGVSSGPRKISDKDEKSKK